MVSVQKERRLNESGLQKCAWQLLVGRWHRIYATPSRSICGSEKDAEIRNRKSRCVAVCLQRATTTIESVL